MNVSELKHFREVLTDAAKPGRAFLRISPRNAFLPAKLLLGVCKATRLVFELC
jgi:hypothetical protein